jgi:eukaryotic-like serine/threonine-protein kinase
MPTRSPVPGNELHVSAAYNGGLMGSRPQPMADAPVRVGRYTVFEPIGMGGMASVHLGRVDGAAGFSRVVAIKRPHAHQANDPSFVSMFVDEMRLASSIRHPNVAAIIDVSASDDEFLLVMEYVHGESLASLFRSASESGQAIPIEIASTIIVGVLLGLHAAHETLSPDGRRLDIVHRDVSPANVLVGTDGLARVIDFGIARATTRIQTTRDGQLKGKLSYMSPEQLAAEPVDRRSDVFAASVVYWELLTGTRLFLADAPGTIVSKVLTADVAPPSSFRAEVGAALDAVLLKGLSKSRDDRWATAKEMAEAIERATKLASATVVGAWVEDRGGIALRQRLERVLEIRAGAERDDSAPLPASVRDVAGRIERSEADTQIGTATENPNTRRRAMGGPLVLLGIAVVVCLGVFFALRSSFVREPTVSSIVTASPQPTAPPEPAAPVGSSNEPPPPTTAVLRNAAAPSAPPRGAVRPSTNKHPKAALCDPPYVWDPARNIKVFREECLH